MDIGANIRSRRARLGLTLVVLARGSGVSRAMLSDVERGHRSPTIKILSQIAVGLGCRVSDLLEEAAPRRPHLERADQHPRVLDEVTGVERITLRAPLMPRGTEIVWYRLPAGAEMRRGPQEVVYASASRRRSGPFPPNPHGTAEHVAVVSGRASFRCGDLEQTLRTGDAVNYRIEQQVAFANPGKRACLLSLLIDTGFQRRE